jgi:hypothetical protein
LLTDYNKENKENMRKIAILFVSIMLLTLSPLFITDVFGDQPPDPGGEPTNGTPVGGSPIGSGLVILSTLGIAYGMKKIHKHNWNEKDN